jgi:hypothetical protein
MSQISLPPGIELRDGSAPVVLYAPHGGRRRRPVKRSDSVNDLHTADLTAELAARLDAPALINRGLDRNDADLNRVSALTSTAAGVLGGLRALVERASNAGPTPLVLLVHGWNVAQPACDVGVGLVERDFLTGAHPSISCAAFESFVRPLTAALVRSGIDAPIGRRYPAAGRDNATQLFSGRHCGHQSADAASLSALARSGGVDAVQLELAIPLRWPGRYREAFLDAVVAAVQAHFAAAREQASQRCGRSEWQLASARDSEAKSPPVGWSVQAVLEDGAGLFIGAEPTGPRDAAARLCVVRRDGRMLLFVGEGGWQGDENRHRVGGLEWEAETRGKGYRGRRIRIRYEGPMVLYPTHDAFCDLELGLAGAEVTEAKAELSVEIEGETFGSLRGYLRTNEETMEIDCLAVCERGSRRGTSASARSRVIVVRSDDPFGSTTAEQREVLDWHTDAAGEICDFAFDVEDGESATASVLTRVPVYRVIRDDVVVKVTFGTATVSARAGSPRATAAEDMRDALALFERIEIFSGDPASE